MLFERAFERGEADPERVTEWVKTLPFDLLRREFTMTFKPAADDVPVEIVDAVPFRWSLPCVWS